MNLLDEQKNFTNQSHQLTKIRLILAYNGASFHGWQSQKDGSGIQDYLEDALKTMLRVPTRVTASSRTDTGVHAAYQVVAFSINESEPNLVRMVKGLNAILPQSVRVRDASIVASNFHPIFHAKAKLYRYQIWQGIGEDPFMMPFVWHWSKPLDIVLMQEACKYFVGTHDFTSFCSTDSTATSKTRTIYDIHIVAQGPLLCFWFFGEGFLKQMVRTIVGTLVAVGLGKLLPKDIPSLFMALDRRMSPATAPAQGLCLVKVFYGENIQLDALIDRIHRGYNWLSEYECLHYNTNGI